MSLGRRLINTGGVAACTTDSADPFGDGYGVALYSLDYDASDASGSYDGTPTDVDFGVGGNINYGARFNGSSSRIENIDTAPLSTATSFSVSAWIKTTSTNRQFIYGDSKYTTNTILGVENNTIEFRSETSAFNTSTLTISDDNWHHIVMTVVSGGNMNIYFDGNLVDTETAGTFVAGSGYQTIGVYRSATPTYIDYFNGSIDQVRIFNKALSSDEVSTLYAEEACVYTSTTDIVNYPTGTTPVAYYKLDNSSEDYSTGGNDGTDTNVEYRFGRYGQAAVFNGSSSKIDTGFAQNTNNAFSWSLWFKANSSQSSNAMIMDTTSNSSPFPGVGIGLASATDLRAYQSGSGSRFTHTNNTITSDTWVHVAYTHDGSGNFNFYINNQLSASGNYTSNLNSGNNILLGDTAVSTWNNFNGSIDQVRIYSTALDSDQVSQLYNEKQNYITKDAADPFGDSSSVALYEMENNANDSSGNGNNGIQSNVTFTTTDSIRGAYSASFNGSSSRIVTGVTPATGSGQFSVSGWVNVDSLSAIRGVFSTITTPGTDRKGFTVHVLTSGIVRALVYDSAGADIIESTDLITVGNWHHIAITYNNGLTKLYVDGGVQSDTVNQLITGYHDSINIGRYYASIASLTMLGKIDQVRIFDTALEGDQIFKLYAEGVRGTGL